MIEGLLRIPLRRFEDERGWFAEIRRESLLPKQTFDHASLLTPVRWIMAPISRSESCVPASSHQPVTR